MDSSVEFIAIGKTTEQLSDCIQVTLFWYCCNQSFRAVGTGDDNESALEAATIQFNNVMNNLLGIA